jgi:hypothetical protein
MNPEEGYDAGRGPSRLGAMARAFYPSRWGLCLAALMISLGIAALALGAFEGKPGQQQEWLQRPLDELQLLARALFGNGLGSAFFRCSLLGAALWLIWSFVGCWIARAEFLRRLVTIDSSAAAPGHVTPTRLEIQKGSSLAFPALSFVFLLSILLPGLVGGVIMRVPVLGPIVMALLLPLLIAFSFMIAFIVVGMVSFPLMPVTIAAEGSDSYDAISRAFSYLYQRPLLYAWWQGVSVIISALPLVGVLWLFQDRSSLAVLAAAALSLSLFWTFQGLVYSKIRRAIDEIPEDEIWSGADAEQKETLLQKLDQTAGEPCRGRAKSTGEDSPPAKQVSAGTEKPTKPLLPKRPRLSFHDTLGRGPVLDYRMLLGIIWVGLVLIVASWVAWKLVAPGGQGLTAEGMRDAVCALARERPELFAILAGVVVFLGALGLNRIIKMAARSAAVRAVYDGRISQKAASRFARHTRFRCLVGVLLVTAGVEFYLVAGVLMGLVYRGTGTWEEALWLMALAVALAGLGSLGISAVAVENRQPDEAASGVNRLARFSDRYPAGTRQWGEERSGALGICVRNGPEIIASAAVELVLATLRTAVVLFFAAATWFVTCESLSWLGGDRAGWVRWGLDGSLVPDGAEAGQSRWSPPWWPAICSCSSSPRRCPVRFQRASAGGCCPTCVPASRWRISPPATWSSVRRSARTSPAVRSEAVDMRGRLSARRSPRHPRPRSRPNDRRGPGPFVLTSSSGRQTTRQRA